MSLPASILVGVTGNAVYIKVRGKGSFQNSPALKEFARQMLERGHRVFAFDLSECTVMDSTFMGTLAGMALRLRECGGTLLVRNVNERNFELLRNLGLNNLFQIEPSSELLPSGAANGESALETENDLSRSEHAACMIEAHEALVDAAPENLARFKDVLEYLKQDLRTGAAK
ncbi:MAG: STAS domain-containing protein [Chthoniobacterales bacterium]